MKINIKARAKNELFWITLIPAVLLLIQAVLAIFGVEFDYTDIQSKLTGIVEAIFGVLVILGVVIDPTTKGASDSDRAMTYDKPAEE